jgi:glycyl-tRNA synthetase beta chain
LRGFFLIGELPTGSKDPFALRRAALAIIRLVLDNGLRGNVSDWLNHALALHLAHATGHPAGEDIYLEAFGGSVELKAGDRVLQALPLPADASRYAGVSAETIHPGPLAAFMADRLKVQQREAGVRHDLIDAVFALGGEDDLVRLLARVHALQAFVGTEDGANLLAGYKRAANILKKEDWHGIEGEIAITGEEDPLAGVDDPDLAAVIAAKMSERHAAERDYATEPAEQALIDALAIAAPRAEQAIAAEDFAGAMAALASLRAPIDSFFDSVTVNDADPAKRHARLALLDQFRAAVHNVADFSRIEG